MAALLILNEPDSIDPRHFQRGDIVHVAEDDHVWGGKEGMPTFIRANLHGTPAAQIKALEVKHEVTVAESAASAVRAIARLLRGYAKTQEGQHIACRRYCVPEALLTPDAGGYIPLTLDQIKDKKHAA